MNWDCVAEDIKKVVGPDRVLRNEPMSKHTSFRIGGPADILVQPENIREFCELQELMVQESLPWQVIGNGSNLLVCDSGIAGIVVQLGDSFSKVSIEGTIICCQGGALLSVVASRALEAGLTGFEFAGGIPGTVGGAVVMNAGAYGGEIKDVLESVTVLTPEGSVVVLEADDLNLAYRHSSVAENHFVVLEVVLNLTQGDPEEIRAVTKELTQRRVSKQPLHLPSAGSTFKRPNGYFAGQLIEEAGLKGVRYGDAQVSEKHCGFVVNVGKATCHDVWTLMQLIRRVVRDRSGVLLEPEVRLIGREYDFPHNR